jgi:DNA-directed RNA polymerase specialized sigma24 family protein
MEFEDHKSSAFISALQVLPPLQRSALLLSDVAGFDATDIADILESNEEAVVNALAQARATLVPLLSKRPVTPALSPPRA